MSGRLGIGIACGLFTGLVPLYITEVAPVHLRGGLGTFNQLAVTSGILLRFVDISVFRPVKKNDKLTSKMSFIQRQHKFVKLRKVVIVFHLSQSFYGPSLC